MSFDKHAIETVANKPSSHFQLTTTELYNKILKRNEAELTELGAINAKTGEYTG
ncbi:phosphoenolpyruvate carboxykinase (ATP), partial [Staphylococcus pseudintermedius]